MDVTQQAEQVLEAVALEEEEFEYRGNVPPERIAWFVLLGAFLLFCTVTLSSIYGVFNYLFQSTVPLSAMLHVAKGTIGITGSDLIEAVERDSKDLTNAVTSVSTDSLSQATIQFRTVGAPDLLAAVTLQGNTFVTYNYANRPRFEWSVNPQRVQFSRLRGELDILVTGAADHSFLMDIYTDGPNTDKGVHVQIVENGRYRLSVSEDEVRLLNLVGAARAFFRDDAANPRRVSSGEELMVRIGNRRIETQPTTDNVLSNTVFSLLDWRQTGNMLPDWDCSIAQVQLPAGNYSLEDFDGRVSLRLRRVNNAQSNGEVRCVQTFEGDGLDVRGYDSLSVLTTFRPNYQSLSVCGRLASECPLMLRIDYFDENGNKKAWLRGFYYAVSTNARLQCDTCIQDHVDTNQEVWYTFDSDNLFNLIAEEVRPARIKSVTFYASGHQFDTTVSEMLLLLGRNFPD